MRQPYTLTSSLEVGVYFGHTKRAWIQEHYATRSLEDRIQGCVLEQKYSSRKWALKTGRK